MGCIQSFAQPVHVLQIQTQRNLSNQHASLTSMNQGAENNSQRLVWALPCLQTRRNKTRNIENGEIQQEPDSKQKVKNDDLCQNGGQKLSQVKNKWVQIFQDPNFQSIPRKDKEQNLQIFQLRASINSQFADKSSQTEKAVASELMDLPNPQNKSDKEIPTKLINAKQKLSQNDSQMDEDVYLITKIVLYFALELSYQSQKQHDIFDSVRNVIIQPGKLQIYQAAKSCRDAYSRKDQNPECLHMPVYIQQYDQSTINLDLSEDDDSYIDQDYFKKFGRIRSEVNENDQTDPQQLQLVWNLIQNKRKYQGKGNYDNNVNNRSNNAVKGISALCTTDNSNNFHSSLNENINNKISIVNDSAISLNVQNTVNQVIDSQNYIIKQQTMHEEEIKKQSNANLGKLAIQQSKMQSAPQTLLILQNSIQNMAL